MARSVWKGPFVELSLLKKAEEAQEASSSKPIKTWSRRSTILPQFVGPDVQRLQRSEIHPGFRFGRHGRPQAW